jgi:hypothetical protein
VVERPEGLRILSDCKAVWDENPDLDFLPTKMLHAELNDREDWPWAAWNAGEGLNVNQLAGQLKAFEVKPTQRRIEQKLFGNGKPTRGYERGTFEKAWRDFGLLPDISCTPRRAA